MKLLFGLLFVFGCASSSKPKITTCEQFKQQVLVRAIHVEESTEGHGDRFVKDEKEALSFLEQYEVKRLGLAERRQLREQEMIDCAAFKHEANLCEGQFPNYNFLRGLIYGMKHYGWSRPTIDKGIQVTLSYLNATAQDQYTLFDMLMSASLLNYLNQEGLINGPSKNETQKFMNQTEKLSSKHRNHLKAHPAKVCGDYQKLMKDETKAAKDLASTLRGLLAKLK